MSFVVEARIKPASLAPYSPSLYLRMASECPHPYPPKKNRVDQSICVPLDAIVFGDYLMFVPPMTFPFPHPIGVSDDLVFIVCSSFPQAFDLSTVS